MSQETLVQGNYLIYGRLHGVAGEVFDKTKKKGFPFKFQLGGGRIIEGLERGVRGMCKGETRSLLVPPELGSGSVPQFTL